MAQTTKNYVEQITHFCNLSIRAILLPQYVHIKRGSDGTTKGSYWELYEPLDVGIPHQILVKIEIKPKGQVDIFIFSYDEKNQLIEEVNVVVRTQHNKQVEAISIVKEKFTRLIKDFLPIEKLPKYKIGDTIRWELPKVGYGILVIVGYTIEEKSGKPQYLVDVEESDFLPDDEKGVKMYQEGIDKESELWIREEEDAKGGEDEDDFERIEKEIVKGGTIAEFFKAIRLTYTIKNRYALDRFEEKIFANNRLDDMNEMLVVDHKAENEYQLLLYYNNRKKEWTLDVYNVSGKGEGFVKKFLISISELWNQEWDNLVDKIVDILLGKRGEGVKKIKAKNYKEVTKEMENLLEAFLK